MTCYRSSLTALALLMPLWPHGSAVADPPASTDRVIVSTDAELRKTLAGGLPPGATLLIAPGRYTGGLSMEGARGTEGKPIVIGAADPKNPPVIAGGALSIHLRNPAYLTIQDLVFEAPRDNGMNIDDGGSMTLTARHITLRNLTFRNLRGRGNNDALKLSGVEHFVVERCTIENWGGNGSGIDMVGCHNGRISHCRLKHENGGSNGVQAKGGSTRITIEHCSFENAGQRAVNIGGSTGMAYFRPQPPANFEAKDITVRDCAFRGSLAPINFVGVDGAVVEDCVIYRPGRWAIRILQETREARFAPSRNGVFRRNVVVFRSDEVRTAVSSGDGTAPETFTFEANEWYCQDNPSRSRPSLPSPEKDGVYGRDPKLRDPDRGDFRRR